jgi:Tripartite tricarboxylate transporter TctB family
VPQSPSCNPVPLVKLPDSKDFWSGVMLIAIGAVAVIMARDYPFGTARQMGAGFFPVVLGAALVLFGLYFVARGLRSSDRIAGNWSPRALVILPLAFVLFGLLMQYAGFIPAMLVLIVGSAAAGTEFRFVEVVALSLLLTGLCVALFIWALGLPYPLIVGL